MMPTQAEFTPLIADAYDHLYDLVALRNHALAHLLVPDPAVPQKERGWEVHRLLLKAIEELNPGPKAPAFSLESRRHQLMVLRYVDGLDAQTVADHLSISRRHFYREQEVAMESVARVLRDWASERATSLAASREVRGPMLFPGPVSGTDPMDRERLELLRLEAARTGQAERFADVCDLLQGALALLQHRLAQRDLTLTLDVAGNLPRVAVARSLVRQMLLSALSYVVERAACASLNVSAGAKDGLVHVTAGVNPPAAIEERPEGDQDDLLALRNLAALGNARLQTGCRAGVTYALELLLPAASRHTVLVVDDNPDTLELMKRYLVHHGYAVTEATSANEGVSLAHTLRPYAVTLDLMMPEQDGWDVLQALRNSPDTEDIPVIVCSVLHASELALSLGATAFLPKPVVEEDLQAILESLDRV